MDLRDAIRRQFPDSITADGFAYRLNLDPSEAERLIEDLADSGYIEAAGPMGYFKLTLLGGALRNATARKPVKRAVAERHLAGLLERVDEVNEDEELLFYVDRVVLFGSMLSNSPTVGDIDVAIDLGVKTTDDDEFNRWSRARTQAALAAGKQLSTIVEQVTWSRQEVLVRLKNRSPLLSMTVPDDGVLGVSESKVIFERVPGESGRGGEEVLPGGMD